MLVIRPPSVSRRAVSSSTQLIPSILPRIVGRFSKAEAVVLATETPLWKTQQLLQLAKPCLDTSNSPSFRNTIHLFQRPVFGLTQKRYHGSVATIGGNPFSTPDFSETRSQPSNAGYQASPNKPFTYFVVGATGVLGGMAAKSTAMNFLSSLSASGDVLALAQVEIELATIPLGKSVVIKWRGKPVFIRHRTPEEIEEAQAVDVSSLRDPQTDADRTMKPEWIVMMGVCTHLGCVPVADSGDFGGWYCPCQ
jgi:ubiquinol-cytochrome c reductase iron-sulfur subunit